MKSFRSLALLFFVTFGLFNQRGYSSALLDLAEPIVGQWRFIGYIYDGQYQDAPNPELILTFEFFSDGTDLLRWYRLNEEGFCERKGRYSYSNEQLSDEVIWVNPDNVHECQNDPDMILGRKSVTPVRVKGDRLYMDLPLSERTLTYIWTRETIN